MVAGFSEPGKRMEKVGMIPCMEMLSIELFQMKLNRIELNRIESALIAGERNGGDRMDKHARGALVFCALPVGLAAGRTIRR